MKDSQNEYDSPWKNILEWFLEDFILFYFPDVHNQIDWSKGFEFLDKELQQIIRESEIGKKVVDKLIKVYLKDGEEIWVLTHIEIQSQVDPEFEKRMYIYNYRIFDRYNRKVGSLAVLADENKDWLPNEYGYKIFGNEIKFKFSTVKLLEYAKNAKEIEKSNNIFSIVSIAHIKSLETRKNMNERLNWKINIVKKLYEKGYSKEVIIKLFRFIDWIILLPKEMENNFLETIRKYEENKKMEFIAPFEEIALEKGMEKGKKITARNLLKLGVNVDTIEKATGLSKEEVRTIEHEEEKT
jgi:predicted transposase/invertase (TIGR01784 family)